MSEQTTMKVICVIMALGLVGMILVMTLPTAKKDVSAASVVVDGEFADQSTKAPEKADFDAESGMPCVNREAFDDWYANYSASSVENEEETAETVEATPEIYTVNSEPISEDLQRYLYNQLSRYGKEWFFPIAVAQIYQESRWNTLAENPNGLDKGLCQFRTTYFEEMAKDAGLYEFDIMNPLDSLWTYAYTMARYLEMTSDDVPMALSLYYSGPNGAYADDYVQDVMQWMPTMEEIE